MATQENRFMSWRDMVFTPLVSATIIALAVLVTWQLYQHFALDSFLCFISLFIATKLIQ